MVHPPIDGPLAARCAELEDALAALRSELSAARAELERNRVFTDVLLDTIPVGIVSCDADGGAWVRNKAVRGMLGLPDAARSGVSPEVASAVTHIRDASGQRVPVADYPILRALRGESVGQVELLVGPAGRAPREVQTYNAQILGADGEVLGAVSALTDVTMQRTVMRDLAAEQEHLLEAQAETQHAESRFRKVFDQAGIGAVIVGLDGIPTQVNEAACILLDRPPELLVGRFWTDYLAPGQVTTGQLIDTNLKAGHDTFRDERRYLRPDGSVVWVSAHLSLVRDDEGEPDYLLVQLADITERTLMERTLDHRALHDPLTDLANRSLFAERVRQALLESSPEVVAVVVMLVTGLDAVTDQSGYAASDAVLQEVGRRLVLSVDGDVTIGHLQPGQFAVLVKGSSHDSVRAAEQTLATVSAAIQLSDGPVTLQASVGICAAPSGAEDPETLVPRLIQDAVDAAGRARADGSASRGRGPSWGLTDAIAFAAPEMRQEQEERRRTELLLRRALDNDTVRMAYQPVVDLATGAVVGAEALLRISDDEGRPLPPQELIAVAEESGLIVEIGRRVLRLAAEQSARWRAVNGVLLPIAVNVSAVQLESETFLDDVLRAAERAGLPHEALSIELTESVLLESGSLGIDKLRALRDEGILLAIDDFGTGYASLSYLRNLPASTLKIDASFVDGIPEDRAAVAIVAGVIGLARNFGMTCIAEGIETEAQLSYLADRGVHGQGYLLGRPADGSVIGELLGAARGEGQKATTRSWPENGGREAVADRRDDLADVRDQVGDLRDARADQRDDAAARRDLAADTRDEVGAVRDEAAQIRDDEADEVGTDLAPSAGDGPVNVSLLARRGAARDRRARATERTSAGIDRAAASTDRDAGASARVQAELDRNIALADRGAASSDARDDAQDDG
jgi:PAS domain S-box-containing protein/diguanylate cyclase (GGDEF)-like protein